MKFDLPKLGAGMLAASPVLLNFVGGKAPWFIGIAFAAVGPFLISVKSKRTKS